MAVGRVRESDDDELAYAYYCANVPPAEEAAKPYDRKAYSRLAAKTSMTHLPRPHIHKLVQMVAKAVGADPHGRLAYWGGDLLWWLMRRKARRLSAGSGLPLHHHLLDLADGLRRVQTLWGRSGRNS